MPSHDTTIQIRISSALKSQAEEAAERDRRRLSDWIRLLIEDAVANPNRKAQK